jgi:hypothetical protein
MRGGSSGGRSGGGHNGGGYNNGGGSHHSSGQSGGRRVNPRVQTFDSNGPDVRIRGTAYQINEKYVTLARDATSAGDRVLAESYLQHAEHYQRFINEMTEEFNQYNQQNPQLQPQPMQVDGVAVAPAAAVVTPQTEALSDLDQGFLVGPRHGNGSVVSHNGSAVSHNGGAVPQAAMDGNGAAVTHNGAAVQHNGSGEQPREEGHHQRGRHYSPRRNETDGV